MKTHEPVTKQFVSPRTHPGGRSLRRRPYPSIARSHAHGAAPTERTPSNGDAAGRRGARLKPYGWGTCLVTVPLVEPLAIRRAESPSPPCRNMQGRLFGPGTSVDE